MYIQLDTQIHAMSLWEYLVWWLYNNQTKFIILQFLYHDCLTLRTSEAGIPTLCKLPYGVRSRYTGSTEANARRQKSVYRRHGMSTPGARSRYTDVVF